MIMNKKEFLDEVRKKWCEPLRHEQRFVKRSSLLEKFESQKTPEIINELILANLILNDKSFVCKKLSYEPQPQNVDTIVKTIDFCFETADERIVYCDVKTIKPKDNDAWEKFVKHQKYFPKNVNLHLEQDGMGGEIYHSMHNARASMLTYTLELEQKIGIYGKVPKTHFILVLCGNGFHWHLDEFEDFSDFYIAGRHNPGDQFSEMENHHITEKQISFNKTIDRFAYLKRQETNIELEQFCCPVQGPWVGNRWRAKEKK